MLYKPFDDEIFINQKEKYEELKKYINSLENSQEWMPALYHMSGMEIKIERLEQELKEYRDFFILMDKFLPKHDSNPRY